MFKYSSFSEYSLINLINNEIYLNHYDAFNDPFECRCEVLVGFPKMDPTCTRFRKIVKAWGFDDANDEVAKQHYNEYASSLEGCEPDIPAILDSARISCFSKNCTNLLMWSHYANGLRGFCIEFDPDLLLSNCTEGTELYDVRYKSAPSIIDTALVAVLNDQVDYHGDSVFSFENEAKHLGVDRSPEIKAYKEVMDDALRQNREIYQSMFAVKPMDWKYEEEVRIISDSGRMDKTGEFLKFPPEAIRSVIFGEKMPIHHRQAITKVIERHPTPVSIKVASRVNGEFNIVLS